MKVDLNDMRYFAEVVRHRGFTAAARAMNVSKSLLSRRVAELENQIGARLINRTSRTFSVSELGERYAQACRMMIEQADLAQRLIGDAEQEPRGKLRISAPVMMSEQILSPLLARFMVQYPLVQLEILALNRAVSPLEEGIDIALLSTQNPLPDSSLHARQLGQLHNILVASPTFAAQAGSFTDIEQLTTLPVLARHSNDASSIWQLEHPDGRSKRLNLNPRLLSNNLVVLLDAAKHGNGIALVPDFACRHEIARGELQRILSPWQSPPTTIYALYPSRLGLTAAGRCLLENLITHFS